MIAAILPILLIVCLVMGYRYRVASIEGVIGQAQPLGEKMLATLERYSLILAIKLVMLTQGQDLITDINTVMSITDSKAHLKVSFVYTVKVFIRLTRVESYQRSVFMRSSRVFLKVIHCQKKRL